MNALFNPNDGSTLFSLENGDVWLFKFGIEMVMTGGPAYKEMIFPDITKEFMDGLEQEDLPKIKFDAELLPFATALLREIISELEEKEVDAESISRTLFAMDYWLVGDDYFGNATLQ